MVHKNCIKWYIKILTVDIIFVIPWIQRDCNSEVKYYTKEQYGKDHYWAH